MRVAAGRVPFFLLALLFERHPVGLIQVLDVLAQFSGQCVNLKGTGGGEEGIAQRDQGRRRMQSIGVVQAAEQALPFGLTVFGRGRIGLGLEHLGGAANRGGCLLTECRQQGFSGVVGGGAFAQPLQVGAGLEELSIQPVPIRPERVQRVFYRRRGRGQVEDAGFGGVALLEIGQGLRQGGPFCANLGDGLLTVFPFPPLAFGLQLLLQSGGIDGVAIALGAAHQPNSTR